MELFNGGNCKNETKIDIKYMNISYLLHYFLTACARPTDGTQPARGPGHSRAGPKPEGQEVEQSDGKLRLEHSHAQGPGRSHTAGQ